MTLQDELISNLEVSIEMLKGYSKSLPGISIARHDVEEEIDTLEDLLGTIKAGRCDNCKSYDYSSGYCDSNYRLMSLNYFCWLFKRK